MNTDGNSTVNTNFRTSWFAFLPILITFIFIDARPSLMALGLVLCFLKSTRQGLWIIGKEVYGSLVKDYSEHKSLYLTLPSVALFIFGFNILLMSLIGLVWPEYLVFLSEAQSSLFNLNKWYLFFLIVIFAPIFEEIIFRYYFLRGFEKILSTYWAIGISVILFSALHIQAALHVTVVAVFLSLYAVKSRRLWLSTLLHALNNLIAFSLYFFPVNNVKRTDVTFEECLGGVILGLLIILVVGIYIYVNKTKRNHISLFQIENKSNFNFVKINPIIIQLIIVVMVFVPAIYKSNKIFKSKSKPTSTSKEKDLNALQDIEFTFVDESNGVKSYGHYNCNLEEKFEDMLDCQILVFTYVDYVNTQKSQENKLVQTKAASKNNLSLCVAKIQSRKELFLKKNGIWELSYENKKIDINPQKDGKYYFVSGEGKSVPIASLSIIRTTNSSANLEDAKIDLEKATIEQMQYKKELLVQYIDSDIKEFQLVFSDKKEWKRLYDQHPTLPKAKILNQCKEFELHSDAI